MELLGTAGFALMALSDWNDLRWGRRGLRFLFPAGAAALCVAIALGCGAGKAALTGPGRWLAGALGAVFLALEIHALFFALPAQPSYSAPGEKRPAVTGGVYAMCRHPGVVWMAGLLVCLWLAWGLPLRAAALYTLLDVGLAAFEDQWVFPTVLEGYGAYRETTPFLIPTARSLRAWLDGKT